MIKVGTRVRYIHKDTEDEKKTGCYPPIGTCGTVVYADDLDTFQVEWDEGTDGDGIWWCEPESVEVIAE